MCTHTHTVILFWLFDMIDNSTFRYIYENTQILGMQHWQHRARLHDGGSRRHTPPSAGGLVVRAQDFFLKFGPKHETNTLEEAGEDNQAVHPAPANDIVVDRAILQAESTVELNADIGGSITAGAAAADAGEGRDGTAAADVGAVERGQR